MVVILTTVPTAKQYVLKMFYYFLEYHGTTERSGADPRLLPRCLRFSHTSLLRRKVANFFRRRAPKEWPCGQLLAERDAGIFVHALRRTHQLLHRSTRWQLQLSRSSCSEC